MRTSQKLYWLTIAVICSLAGLSAVSSARADVTGTVAANGNGTFTYSYTVDNSSGTFDVAAWSLDFMFTTPDWDQFDTFSGGDVTVPNLDWLGQAGIPIIGQSAQDFLSLGPAADVAVGSALTGFAFTSAFGPGPVPFYEYSAVGDSATGTTVGPASAVASVPDFWAGLEEMALIGTLLVGGLARNRRSAALTS